MMNTDKYKIYNKNDIEIFKNGISIDGTFFGKEEIANTFNELILVRNYLEKQKIEMISEIS